MYDRIPDQLTQETADLTAVRFYALGSLSTRGMREWLGVPGSADPADSGDLGTFGG